WEVWQKTPPRPSATGRSSGNPKHGPYREHALVRKLVPVRLVDRLPPVRGAVVPERDPGERVAVDDDVRAYHGCGRRSGRRALHDLRRERGRGPQRGRPLEAAVLVQEERVAALRGRQPVREVRNLAVRYGPRGRDLLLPGGVGVLLGVRELGPGRGKVALRLLKLG